MCYGYFFRTGLFLSPPQTIICKWIYGVRDIYTVFCIFYSQKLRVFQGIYLPFLNAKFLWNHTLAKSIEHYAADSKERMSNIPEYLSNIPEYLSNIPEYLSKNQLNPSESAIYDF